MSYQTEIQRSGDWKVPFLYKRAGAAYDIESATNYALVLFYESGEEIVKMAKNVVTADTDYETWLTAGISTGKFNMNVRREVVEAFKPGARIFGIFYIQEVDAVYDSSQFRPAFKIELGTSGSLLITKDLTT